MSNPSGRLPAGHRVAERYQVNACLGAGEMGEVYDVRDSSTGYAYALKLFRPDALKAGDAWAVFEQETRKASDLGIAEIAKAYEFGTEEKFRAPWMLGELVVSRSLQELVRADGPLSIPAWEALLRTIAPVLDKAHASGVVHRALKPTNLFAKQVDQGAWQIRITDFGLASLRTRVPPAPGWTATPGWLPAEQADPSTPPAAPMDVYALALVGFYVLTGKQPFRACQEASTDLNILWAEMTAPMPPASVRAKELGTTLSPTLDPWFARAWAVIPSQRFKSVGDMSRALWSLVGSSQHVVTMRPPAAVPEPAAKPELVKGQQKTILYGMEAVPIPPPPATPTATPAPVPVPGAMTPSPPMLPLPPLPGQPSQRTSVPPPPPRGISPATPAPPPLSTDGRPRRIAAAQDGGQDVTLPIKRSKLVLVGAGAGVILIVVVAVVLLTRRHGPSGQAVASASASSSAPSATVVATASAPPIVPDAAPAPPTETGTVKLKCKPTCDEVKCDDAAVDNPENGFALPVGKHSCTGSKNGYASKTVSVEVKAAGQEVSTTLTLAKSAAGGGGGVAKPPPPAKTPPTKTPPPAKTCGTFVNPCKK